MKNKISFDYDGTLQRKDIQEYCKELIERGYECHICTSRQNTNDNQNLDLYQIAHECGIPKKNITFTSFDDKYKFLNEDEFIFHIDDDNIELSFFRSYSKITPIFLFGNKEWKMDCETAILTNI